MSRTQDTSTLGRVDLENALPASGPEVLNVQRNINSINAFTGRPENSAADAVPAWNSNELGTTDDTLKDRIEAIDFQFQDLSNFVDDASETQRGVVNIADQSFGGFKTFVNGLSALEQLFVGGKFLLSVDEDDTTTGTDQTIDSPESLAVRVSDPALDSIEGIVAPEENSQLVFLINATGQPVSLVHDQGTNENRFFVPTEEDFELLPNALVAFLYDPTAERWLLLGGSGSGDLELAAVGSTPNPNAATVTGGVLNLEPADQFNPGVVTIGAQEFAGSKTFKDNLIVEGVANLSGPLQYSYQGRAPFGADQVLTEPESIILGLTDDALDSVAGISPRATPNNFDFIYLWNESDTPFTLLHDSSATSATERFICPQGQDLIVEPQEFIPIFYDRNFTRWRVVSQGATIGGGGAGGGLFVVDDFTGTSITMTSAARQAWRYTGSSAQTLSSVDLSNLTDGEELEILGTDDADTITVNGSTTGIVAINGSWQGYEGSLIRFRYDDGLGGLVEVSRNGI
jgi:hypothetical protein